MKLSEQVKQLENENEHLSRELISARLAITKAKDILREAPVAIEVATRAWNILYNEMQRVLKGEKIPSTPQIPTGGGWGRSRIRRHIKEEKP